MIKGLISVGTNSTRALVAEVRADSAHPILARSIGTRIGEGLKERGHLGDEPMRRTLDAVREHLAAIREYTQDVQVIATSGLRRADNAELFAQRIRDLTHSDLRVISGEDEAKCSYAGALSELPLTEQGPYGVADLGGGSTEYAAGSDRRHPVRAVSCEMGAVRLTEALPELSGRDGSVSDTSIAEASALAGRAIAPIAEFERVNSLVIVGGTATSAIGLLRGSRELFAYASLTRDEIRTLTQRLQSAGLEQRKTLPGINPQRADILLAGLIILNVIITKAKHTRAIVSSNDVLLGYLALTNG